MNTPRVVLPTISCSETMTTLGLAVRWDHRSSYTIIDLFTSFAIACTPSREQHIKCFTINDNSDKFGNDDDNDNGNGDEGFTENDNETLCCRIMIMIMKHYVAA